MYHTEVPEELRGRGMAGQLAQAALDHASKESIKVKLTCSYLQHFVDKNDKYKHLVAK
jgi:predicted GNAT family acetyltransferase